MTTHPTPEALADELAQLAIFTRHGVHLQSGSYICQKLGEGSERIRTLSAELAAAMSEVEAQKLDYQRLMDKHNALHINAAQARAEVERLTPKPLTDEQIDRIAENCAKAMPDGIRGFCVTWGWRQFARELLDVCAGHARTPAPPVAEGV